MLFRIHVGSLQDSMKTKVEVNSLNELKDHLNKVYDFYEVRDLRIEHYGYDERVEWNTYIVTGILSFGLSTFKQRVVVGFTNGDITV